MEVKVDFDEKALADALVPKVVDAIETALSNFLHKLFPRWREDEIRRAMSNQYGGEEPDVSSQPLPRYNPED